MLEKNGKQTVHILGDGDRKLLKGCLEGLARELLRVVAHERGKSDEKNRLTPEKNEKNATHSVEAIIV